MFSILTYFRGTLLCIRTQSRLYLMPTGFILTLFLLPVLKDSQLFNLGVKFSPRVVCQKWESGLVVMECLDLRVKSFLKYC